MVDYARGALRPAITTPIEVAVEDITFNAVYATEAEAKAGAATDVVLSPATGKQAIEAIAPTTAAYADATASPYGAVGDGIVDDQDALELANTSGKGVVVLPKGTYRTAASPDLKMPIISFGGQVVPDSGGFFPRTFYDFGTYSYQYNLKVNNPSDYTDTPIEDYTDIDDSNQHRWRWINQAGYQEKATDGNHAGPRPPGKIPEGQSRLARTGSTQFYLHGSHSGQGDGYNVSLNMAVSQHSETALVTFWSGQNSGGLGGGQINALTDKTNLYGFGDIVLSDQGHNDIAMLGDVRILHCNGADSGDYEVPRLAYMAQSGGTNDIDVAYLASGKFIQGLDVSGGEYSSSFGVVMSQGQRIGFDATPPNAATGKYHSISPGSTYMDFDGNNLRAVVDNSAIMRLTSSLASFYAPFNSATILRVFGASASAYGALGQFNAITYLSAGSNASDNTQLAFQTAVGGVEAEAMRITSTGVVRLSKTPTYADNAAAIAGGLMVGDVYMTDTGELRARV